MTDSMMERASAIVAGLLAILAGVGTFIKKAGPTLHMLHEFLEDWRGTPGREGVPEREGVMVRLQRLENDFAELRMFVYSWGTPPASGPKVVAPSAPAYRGEQGHED